MSTEDETLTIRPPWRDELPRLKTFFGEGPLVLRPWRLLTLNASNPERIVGAAGLCADGNSGELLLKLRPRVLQEKHGIALFEAVLTVACDLKLTRLTTQVSVGSSHETFFHAQRFVELRTEELWQLDLAFLNARLTARASSRQSNWPDWTGRTPTNDDVSKLATLFEAHGLFAGDRIRSPSGESAGNCGFDLGSSTVIESTGRLWAALLSEGGSGLDCRVAAMAAAPEAKLSSARLSVLLLRYSVDNWLKQGYVTATLKVDIARHPEKRNLAQRTGGVLLRRVRYLVRDL